MGACRHRQKEGDTENVVKCFCALVVIVQVSQLSQRDCAARWFSYGQKWKTGPGRQFYGKYHTIFNHCIVIGQQSNPIR